MTPTENEPVNQDSNEKTQNQIHQVVDSDGIRICEETIATDGQFRKMQMQSLMLKAIANKEFMLVYPDAPL